MTESVHLTPDWFWEGILNQIYIFSCISKETSVHVDVSNMFSLLIVHSYVALKETRENVYVSGAHLRVSGVSLNFLNFHLKHQSFLLSH